jgi:zinc transporter, ZIP family
MIEFLKRYDPVMQALIATLFTWAVTAAGAAGVFFFKTINKKVLDAMLGFAAGVMIAASFWSLLAPAVEMSVLNGRNPWIPAVIGFLSGGIFLRIADKVLPHLHLGQPDGSAEGLKTSWKRSILLVLAVTLHNIPEGFAIGVAFGAAAIEGTDSALIGAAVLALGIGIQDFPEGFAVSVPLRRENLSRGKSFFYGQLSGFVEPVAGVLGAALVLLVTPLMPYALAFAAGAMIFVVAEELIPESQMSGNTDISTSGLMIGFTVMMMLDVALG